jgi:hypothetical protein
MPFHRIVTLALNLCITTAVAVGGNSLAADRHTLFSEVLGKYVNDGVVDYSGFRKDSVFQQYLDLLSSQNPDSLKSRDEQLSLWINAYNAYTIKLIIDRMPLTSIRDIGLGLPVLSGPWSIEMANVGGTTYTLNEIEHDIIREKFQDPRIHFALVCASKSCPKLRSEAYEGSRLNSQLEADARRFINDPRRNTFDVSARTVYFSKIFDWYESDFEKSSGSVLAFVAPYLSGETRKLVEDPDCRVEYLPYDWMLNGK